MKLIETKTLLTSASSIVFTSIPQDGTDLFLLMSLRDTFAGGGVTQINIQFNSSGGTAYSDRTLEGNGSAAYIVNRTGQSFVRVTAVPGPTFTANTFSNAQLYVPNYSNGATKAVLLDGVSERINAEAYHAIVSGYWNNTSAITAINITTQSTGNFAVGSMASLYKITKGTDGITTVS
jgi:hypothetical protein